MTETHVKDVSVTSRGVQVVVGFTQPLEGRGRIDKPMGRFKAMAQRLLKEVPELQKDEFEIKQVDYNSTYAQFSFERKADEKN